MASEFRFQSIIDELLKSRFAAERLYRNPAAIKYLLALPEDRIDWSALSGSEDPEAVDLLVKNPDKIDWSTFSGNSHPAAVALLLQHPEKIDWGMLTMNNNSRAAEYVSKIVKPIRAEVLRTNDYTTLYTTKDPDVIKFLLKHVYTLDRWFDIPQVDSPVFAEFLQQNLDWLDWSALSANENPAAVDLLRANPGKIDWRAISGNEAPGALDLIGENLDKIDWALLSQNKNPTALELMAIFPEKSRWDLAITNPAAVRHMLQFL